jgi:hypothetical protein
MLEVCVSDMFSYTYAHEFPKSNFLNRHPSESLNNSFFCRRFLNAQTDGRKAELKQ